MPVLGDLGFANSTFSDADFTIVGILFGLLGSNLGRIGVVVGLILVYAAIFGYSFVKKDESEN